MYKLIRFYNQNRKNIIKVILIIAFIILVIQLLNWLTRINKQNEEEDNNIIEKNNTINEIISDRSLISGESISSTKLEEDTEIINKFVKYCNEENIDGAYELLTDECKEEMFPTIDDFNNIYYLKLFGEEKKMHTIENWVKSTYQVRYTGDILSTGNLNNNETRQDYITVIKENDEKKLNINNYLKRTNLNKSTEYKDIKVTVTNIDTYIDYEIYNLTIENNSENDILLDTSDDTESIYLLDSRDMKYYFYNNEIVENRLLVKSNLKNNLKIKFSNSYSSSRRIESLVFSKLILNYKEYKELENKEEYKGFYRFNVDI